MTTTQRDAIASPAEGLIVYVTGSTGGLNYYNSGSTPGWRQIADTSFVSSSLSGSAGYIPVFTGTNSVSSSVIFQSGSSVGIGTTTPTSTVYIKGATATTSSFGLTVLNSNSSQSLNVRDDGMVIVGSGSFIYGTGTNDDGKLTINNTSGYNGLSINSNGTAGYKFTINTTFSDNVGVQFRWHDGTTQPFLQYAGNPGLILGSTGTTSTLQGTSLLFKIGSTEKARVAASTGNFLINTNVDAGYKLDVNGTTRFTGNSIVSGSLNVTSAVTASQALISGSGTQRLIVVGSGSAQPIFTVQGSQGELFSITDSLSGSLFSVNDISGLPILETFSDGTTLMGSYLAPALFTTQKTTTTNSGSFVIYNIPTGSYDGLYVDYTARSGSNARAGQIMAIWSGSSVNYTETTTTDFGTTSNLLLGVSISGSNMALTGSVATGSGWVIKSIIRSI
jgi:hypothetical protein